MTSNALKYYGQSDFRGGICDQQENLNPKNQVLDARNCWAPLGTLVRRPGYVPIAQYDTGSFISTGSTFYLDSSTIYLGLSSIPSGVEYSPNLTNTNAGCQYRYEYWNGTAWMPLVDALQYNFTDTSLRTLAPLYCGASSIFAIWTIPANWATTTVNSLVRYWLRVIPVGTQSPSSTPTSITITTFFDDNLSTSSLTQGLFQFKYNSGQNYVYIAAPPPPQPSTPSAILDVRSELNGAFPPSSGRVTVAPAYIGVAQGTVIPEFNLAYVTYGNVVYQVKNNNTIVVSPINIDPLIVGPGATYDTANIAQLTAFPAANYIINFRGLIWTTGILGQLNMIRWSGSIADGAYNVWPEVNVEFLSTAKDNSPITAVAGLGDNLVVFKQDSIWQMVFNGVDSDTGLPTFIAQLVVTGVGCVAQGSVQQIRGRLIFLGEDGFYAFDGTPNIKKISENVNTTTARINPSHRVFSTAVNWRSKYCYLCSTALDESGTNNIIFVYDYKHEAWWLWDDIPAEFLLTTSDTALQEQVIFGNTTAGIFQLGGETDNFGPIDNYVLTGRLGEDEVMWKSAREVRLREQNIDGTTTYTLYADDLQLGVSSKNCRMDSPDETQADPPPPNGCDNVPVRRRERKMPQRLLGEWFQVKAAGFGLLEGINVGYSPESRR